MSETPFTIQVADSDLELLCKKLKLTHLPDELDDAGWDYGSPLTDIRRLVNRWKNGFDWRASEATINKLPQFTRDIEVEGFGALNIHYVHKRSEVESSIPLLFIHGCKQPSAHCIVYVVDNMASLYQGPGYFLEVQKILPLLVASAPDHPSFHVVAFSLPGYGFSEAPKKKGFAIPQYAEV